jgi:hypothetical protein
MEPAVSAELSPETIAIEPLPCLDTPVLIDTDPVASALSAVLTMADAEPLSTAVPPVAPDTKEIDPPATPFPAAREIEPPF